MVDFRDPNLVVLDLCTYHASSVSLRMLNINVGLSFGRDPHQALPYVGWCLHVSLHFPGACALTLSHARDVTRTGPNTRWEFFTTLDYECRVIQGRQPYRWTIWVCIYGRFGGIILFPRE